MDRMNDPRLLPFAFARDFAVLAQAGGGADGAVECWISEATAPSALAEIGGYFGRRSHSTVISAQKTVGQWVANRSQIVLADSTWNVEEAIRRVEEMLRAG
jgi:hypothetical protein